MENTRLKVDKKLINICDYTKQNASISIAEKTNFTMENLLKQCGIEHLSSVFKQKNIDLATLEMLVDPKKPVHV